MWVGRWLVLALILFTNVSFMSCPFYQIPSTPKSSKMVMPKTCSQVNISQTHFQLKKCLIHVYNFGSLPHSLTSMLKFPLPPGDFTQFKCSGVNLSTQVKCSGVNLFTQFKCSGVNLSTQFKCSGVNLSTQFKSSGVNLSSQALRC